MIAGDFQIQVMLNSKNAPAAFKWLDRMYRVKEVHECWRLLGRGGTARASRLSFASRPIKAVFTTCASITSGIGGAMAVVQD